MAADLSFLAGVGGASRGYTPDARKPDGSLSAATDTPRIEIMGPQIGTLADAATPDPAAANASKSLISLLAGAVAHLLVSRGYLKILSDAAQSTDPSLVQQAATGAISVRRITGIGATGSNAVTIKTNGVTTNLSPTDGTLGVLVSPADTVGRRSFRNTGNVMLELLPAGTAFGNGHPLPPGESFTFDAAGRVTGDIYAAAANAGGSLSILTF